MGSLWEFMVRTSDEEGRGDVAWLSFIMDEGLLRDEAVFWENKGSILDVGMVGRCGLDGRGVGSETFF